LGPRIDGQTNGHDDYFDRSHPVVFTTMQQFIQSTTQHVLVISIKILATRFGLLNHPQASFSKHSTGTGKEM
jgi:hypothetical protein